MSSVRPLNFRAFVPPTPQRGPKLVLHSRLVLSDVKQRARD